MNKKRRWAALIGVVCGAELVVAAVIGGAGIAALVSVEAAVVAAALGGVALWAVFDRRRRHEASPPGTEPAKRSNSELGI